MARLRSRRAPLARLISRAVCRWRKQWMMCCWLFHEWPTASRRSRFSAARHCARLVRDGVGQMASATSLSPSEPFNGYYQSIDYAYWKRRGERASPCPVNRDAGESGNRAIRITTKSFLRNAKYQVRGAAWTAAESLPKWKSAVMAATRGAKPTSTALRPKMRGDFGNSSGKPHRPVTTP